MLRKREKAKISERKRKDEEEGGKGEEEGKKREEEDKKKAEPEEPQQLLSQEEVDALLRGLREGEIPTPPEKEEGPKDKYPKYDFRKVGRFISKMRLPSLEVIHRRFATDSRSILSVALQRIIDLSMVNVMVSEFGNFIDNIPLPALFCVVSMRPLRGFSIWVLEAPLVMAIIDILLGGEGRALKAEGREFTRIEQRLIKRVISTMLKPYAEAWEPIIQIEPEIVRIENHPQFAAIIPDTDLIVSTTYEMDLGMVTGKMYVGIPYSILEPIRSLLQAGYQPANLEVDRKWLERLIERLKEAPVTIKVELGKAKITLRELIELKKGDVIKLNTEPDEDSAIVFVQDVPKFKGVPGKYGNSKAVLITKKVETEEEMREEVLKKLII